MNLTQEARVRALGGRSAGLVGVGLAAIDARPPLHSAVRNVGVAVARRLGCPAAMRSRVAHGTALSARGQAHAGRSGGGGRATDRRALSALADARVRGAAGLSGQAGAGAAVERGAAVVDDVAALGGAGRRARATANVGRSTSAAGLWAGASAVVAAAVRGDATRAAHLAIRTSRSVDSSIHLHAAGGVEASGGNHATSPCSGSAEPTGGCEPARRNDAAGGVAPRPSRSSFRWHPARAGDSSSPDDDARAGRVAATGASKRRGHYRRISRVACGAARGHPIATSCGSVDWSRGSNTTSATRPPRGNRGVHPARTTKSDVHSARAARGRARGAAGAATSRPSFGGDVSRRCGVAGPGTGNASLLVERAVVARGTPRPLVASQLRRIKGPGATSTADCNQHQKTVSKVTIRLLKRTGHFHQNAPTNEAPVWPCPTAGTNATSADLALPALSPIP
jgi:hypothetical protein